MAVAYHWSPSTRRTSIRTRGLVIGAAPSVNGVEDDHRNPWISLAPTAAQAWWLSGGALEGGGFAVEHPVWDLWEADLTDIEHTPGRPDYPEIRVRGDIPSDRLTWIGSRVFGVDAA